MRYLTMKGLAGLDKAFTGLGSCLWVQPSRTLDLWIMRHWHIVYYINRGFRLWPCGKDTGRTEEEIDQITRRS